MLLGCVFRAKFPCLRDANFEVHFRKRLQVEQVDASASLRISNIDYFDSTVVSSTEAGRVVVDDSGFTLMFVLCPLLWLRESKGNAK